MKMTPSTIRSPAWGACGWLLPLLAAVACGPEVHIVASMDEDVAAAGMGGAAPAPEVFDQAGAEGECASDCCSNRVKDGGETGVDCGGVCVPCDDREPCTVAADCHSKSCVSERCVPATCTDGVLNGDEIARDCGGPTCAGCAIGMPCRTDADCLSALCDPLTKKCLLSCDEGTGECDADLSVECETNLQEDVEHCGACGNACSDARGKPGCVNGECKIDCETGYGDCDDDPSNGCERDLTSDVDSCGQCGRRCTAAHGEAYCIAGECGVSHCEEGFDDCNANADGGGDTDGCETNLSTLSDCGSCGHICSSPGAVVSCLDGSCVGVRCLLGYADCNADAGDGELGDGCETYVVNDPDNCDGCRNHCASGVCVDSVCEPSPCEGICSPTELVNLEPGQGYKRDNLGSGEVCVQIVGYDPSPSPPRLVCWNLVPPRTLVLNEVTVACDGIEQELDIALRAGGYCVHVSPGETQFAGFEFPN